MKKAIPFIIIGVLVVCGIICCITSFVVYGYLKDKALNDITLSKYNSIENCYEADSILPVEPGAKCCSDAKYKGYNGHNTGIAGYCVKK